MGPRILSPSFPLLWVNTCLEVNAGRILTPTKTQLITRNRTVLPSLLLAVLHEWKSPESQAIWLCDSEAKKYFILVLSLSITLSLTIETGF